MILSLMIYGMVLALLAAGAAHFLDAGLRALGRPTRWVWAVAMAAGGLAPFLPRLVPEGPPQVLPGGPGFPVELLYEVGAMGGTGPLGSTPLLLAADGSLGVLWILSSLLVLLVFAWACLRLHRQRTGWEQRSISGEEILLSQGLGPAVLGLIRPRIVLPPWALSLSGPELDMVVLHEKEHQAARDPALLAAGLLLAALSPWNPVLWWTLQRLRLAVEGDCDSRVLAHGVSPKSYGRLLLQVASRGNRLPTLAPALTEGGDTFLEKRLMMIRSFVGKNRVWAGVSAALAGAALVVLACETPMPQEVAEEGVVGEAGTGAVGALEVTGEPQAGQRVLLRGAADRKSGGEPLVFIDGVRIVKEAWEGEGRPPTPPGLAGINADDIERIEVIKGDDAVTRYGAEAAAGVILIFTKRK